MGEYRRKREPTQDYEETRSTWDLLAMRWRCKTNMWFTKESGLILQCDVDITDVLTGMTRITLAVISLLWYSARLDRNYTERSLIWIGGIRTEYRRGENYFPDLFWFRSPSSNRNSFVVGRLIKYWENSGTSHCRRWAWRGRRTNLIQGDFERECMLKGKHSKKMTQKKEKKKDKRHFRQVIKDSSSLKTSHSVGRQKETRHLHVSHDSWLLSRPLISSGHKMERFYLDSQWNDRFGDLFHFSSVQCHCQSKPRFLQQGEGAVVTGYFW